MFRWILRLFTLFSFALFAAAASLWVRSFLLVDFVQHQHVERSGPTLALDQRILVSGSGGVCVATRHSAWPLPHRDLSEQQINSFRSGWQHQPRETAGYAGNYFKGSGRSTIFGFGRATIDMKSNGATVKGKLIVFPWAAAVLVLGIVPSFATIRHINIRRRLRRLAALNYNGMNTRRLAA